MNAMFPAGVPLMRPPPSPGSGAHPPRAPAHSCTPAIARRATAQRDVEKLRRQADLDALVDQSTSVVARLVVFCQIEREKKRG